MSIDLSLPNRMASPCKILVGPIIIDRCLNKQYTQRGHKNKRNSLPDFPQVKLHSNLNEYSQLQKKTLIISTLAYSGV